MAKLTPVDMTQTVRAAPDHLAADLGDRAVVLGVEQGRYFGLDKVAARIWELLQAPILVSGIRDTILHEYDVDEATCETDVLAFLASLEAQGMIEVVDAQPG